MMWDGPHVYGENNVYVCVYRTASKWLLPSLSHVKSEEVGHALSAAKNNLLFSVYYGDV